ncbi:class A beta-lactamase-related serine hydrolase [Flavobacteriaceae bacterium AU392]|nr:class A beta-lactamase-related serine hydrolase [Flavobacteriaceae bacterium]RKM85604.1 class A beta-lactamase-related serine hydrolase [Flavobacteriaceae bacterium AU392]
MKNFIILFCLTLNIAFSQSTPESNKNKITQYLEVIKNNYNVPGMVVAVSNKDGIEYIKSFGNVSIEDNFIIGSTSKSFTALMILRLQEKGLLSIHDPVVKYLSWFEYKNKEVSDKVTIKNLLNHASGQPAEIGLAFFPDKDMSDERVILKLIELLKSVKVDKYPIKDFDYSNTNYQILTYIIEEITGKEYSVVLKEEITDLLKLKNTSAVLPSNIAQGYQPFLYYPIIPISENNYNKVDISGGYINSNANDMSMYLREIMNSFNNDSTSVISKNITDQLFKRNEENNADYALGWSTNQYRGTKIFFHNGLTQSFNTAMVVVPEIEKTIIVLANNYGESAFLTSLGVLSILLDKEPFKPSKIYFNPVRNLPFLVLLFLIIFIMVCKKWLRKGKPIGTSRKIVPNLLLTIGIIIALSWTFYLPSIFRASVKAMFEFDITTGVSAVLLTIFTLGISFILYFNSVRKTLPNSLE